MREICMKRILIGCPTYDGKEYCFNEFAKSLKELEKDEGFGFDILFVDNSENEGFSRKIKNAGFNVVYQNPRGKTKIQKIIDAREAIRNECLAKGHDYLLFIDTDVIMPKDALKKLISHGKKAVSAVVLSLLQTKKGWETRPVLYGVADKKLGFTHEKNQKYMRIMKLKDIIESRLTEVFNAGFGCCLISKGILEKTKIRKIAASDEGGEDIAFFEDAKKADPSLRIYADTGVKCIHMPFLKEDGRNELFKYKRVLIGCVTYDGQKYCIDHFLYSLHRQTYQLFDVLFVDNSRDDKFKEYLEKKGFRVIKDSPFYANGNGEARTEKTRIDRIISGRNIIRDEFIKGNYDYLLFADTDVMMPLHILAQLISLNKDVAAGVYLGNLTLDNAGGIMPVLCDFHKEPGKIRPMAINEMMDEKIMKVASGGLGCCLIRKGVLNGIKFRNIGASTTGGEDAAFFRDLRDANFEAYANTASKCFHMLYPAGDKRNDLFKFRKASVEYGFKVSMG